MSSIQIPNMTAAISLDGTEQLEIVQAASSVRTSTQAVANLASGSSARTVASLVVAATAGVGARSFVTDATATTFNSVVSGGGTNKVPVFCDGITWKIG